MAEYEHGIRPGSGAVAYINVSDAKAALAFYERAFGAREVMRIPAEDGEHLMHCQLAINGGTLMMNDYRCPDSAAVPMPLDGLTLHLQVEDVDSWWARALDAGAEVTWPLQQMFWGDRYGRLKDPFGVNWSLGETPKAAG